MMLYCSTCYAVKEDGKCPKCDLHKKPMSYSKFCRRCLHVHMPLAICKQWKAK